MSSTWGKQKPPGECTGGQHRSFGCPPVVDLSKIPLLTEGHRQISWKSTSLPGPPHGVWACNLVGVSRSHTCAFLTTRIARFGPLQIFVQLGRTSFVRYQERARKPLT